MINIDLDRKILNIDETIDSKKIEVYINNIVNLSIRAEKVKFKNINISILSASKNKIKKINNEYRGIDKATDVLSFPIFTKDELLNNKLDNIHLGDIIICLDVVRKQSMEYNTGIERELLYMITHGLLHLLGYDHEYEQDKNNMRQKEEYILKKIGDIKNDK